MGIIREIRDRQSRGADKGEIVAVGTTEQDS